MIEAATLRRWQSSVKPIIIATILKIHNRIVIIVKASRNFVIICR